MTDDALVHPDAAEFLAELTAAEPGPRSLRRPQVLRDPDGLPPSHWRLALPAEFNPALDIRLTARKSRSDGDERTQWTQGSAFAFREGDVLFDSADSYEDWPRRLQRARFALVVRDAGPAVPRQKDAPRDPGKLVLRLYRPDAKGRALAVAGEIVTTQDDLVRFAVLGESEEISARLAGR